MNAPIAAESRALRATRLVAGCAILFAIPLLFALYTGQIWEDFFITFRHSRNLNSGNGLVYNPGERVHGFTSPAGVLLLAACDRITGGGSYLNALWLVSNYRRHARLLRGRRSGVAASLANAPTPVFAGWLLLPCAFDAKGVANSVNRMETAFMLLLVAWHLDLLRRAWAATGWPQALLWASLMW